MTTRQSNVLKTDYYYQIIDDLLDFEGNQKKLGKPANADLMLGIATAPVFFAVQEDQSLRPLVVRRFNQSGDVDLVCIN